MCHSLTSRATAPRQRQGKIMPKPMSDYPKSLRAGSGAAVFERRPDLYAVRQPVDEPSADAIAVIPDDARSTFAVYRGDPPSTRAAQDVGPVYAAAPGGPLAVPTGRVFVRLAHGVRPEERRQEFEAAGFEIDRTLSYAPNAAWLRPVSGEISRALPGLATLDGVPDVVHVEPQMLLERALKEP
jgi:hypothetical protein